MTQAELMELGARLEREARLREEAILLFNTGSSYSQRLWDEANGQLRRQNELKLYEATYTVREEEACWDNED